jgi:AraC-like DNA-binding protein
MYKKNQSLIEEIKMVAGCHIEDTLVDHKIFFVLEGRCHLSFRDGSEHILHQGEMLALSKGMSFKTYMPTDTLFLSFVLQTRFNPHDHFSVTPKSEAPGKQRFTSLQISPVMRYFLEMMRIYPAEETKCHNYIDLKYKEFICILKNHYSQEEVANFFKQFEVRDCSFSDFVLENHMRVKNVSQLAALSAYSLSAFKRRFHANFGQSPYQWMKAQKATHIYYDIKTSDMRFSEICDQYNFSALSQFTTFCKAHFGETPSELRKKTHRGQNINERTGKSVQIVK